MCCLCANRDHHRVCGSTFLAEISTCEKVGRLKKTSSLPSVHFLRFPGEWRKKKREKEICWHTRHYIFQCFDDQRSSSSRTRYPSWKDTSNICRLMSLNRKFVVSCCGKIWSIFRGNFNRALIVFMKNYSVLRERGRKYG